MPSMKVKSWVPSLIQKGKIFNFQFYGDENNDMKKMTKLYVCLHMV